MFNKNWSKWFRQSRRFFSSAKRDTYWNNPNFLRNARIIASATVLGSISYPLLKDSSMFGLRERLNPNNFKVFASQIEIKRILACELEDLQPGQMKEIQVGPNPKTDTVLIANVDGEIFCVGSKCSHYGAPLAQGMLFGERVFCPWHLASFSVKTGYPDFGPVFSALRVYKTEVTDGNIYVHVPEKEPSKFTDVGMVDLENVETCSNERMVVIGAGPAGLAAVETLRQSGFTGKITMINKEGYLPYDRTVLTKNMFGASASRLKVRDAEFFRRNKIFMVNDTAVEIDLKSKEIKLEKNDSVQYDQVLIVTGLRPRKLPDLVGENTQNVFYFRQADDTTNIQNYCTNLEEEPKNIMVLGGRFIGVESASSLKTKYKTANVNLVTRRDIYSNSLGPEIAPIWRKHSENNGVNFLLNQSITKVNKNSDNKVISVTLSTGQTIPTDLLFVAVGSQFNTDFLKDSGLNINSNGSMNVDSFLKAQKDVYVAGDISNVPYYLSGERIRSEHYTEAISQGSCAAWNMLGKFIPYETVPFFWTRAFNKSLACLGVFSGDDKVVIKGNPDKFNFIAYYFGKKGEFTGAVGMGHNKELIALNQAMRMDIVPTMSELVDPAFNWEVLYQQILDSGKKCACQRKCNNDS